MSEDLAFFTNDQLIAELMRRTTFVGLVLSSPQPMRQGEWGDVRTMRLQHNHNLTNDQAGRLCEMVAERIKLEAE